MYCPFYLCSATFYNQVNKSGWTYELELNSEKEDIDDYDYLKANIFAYAKPSKDDVLISIILVKNSLEGGPKIVGQWS